MRHTIILILALWLWSSAAMAQLTQLVYLKTYPRAEYPLLPIDGEGRPYAAGFYGEAQDVSVFPGQDSYMVSTDIDNGISHVTYNPDLSVAGDFETGIYSLLQPIVELNDGDKTVVYGQKMNWAGNPIANLFESDPPLFDVPSGPVTSTSFLLTYNPTLNLLKMPFHCMCPGFAGESQADYELFHGFKSASGLMSPAVLRARYNSAWMSDSTIVMTLSVFDDVVVNWDEEYPIGDNYWGTFWVKVNPSNGMHIVTPMLSQAGTALDYSLNASADGSHLYRTGIMRGNGVQMSPDGTLWNTFDGDSLYYGYLIKENAVGEQSWMTPLFSYQSASPDTVANPYATFLSGEVKEINSHTYHTSYLQITLNTVGQNSGADTLFYNDYIGEKDTLITANDTVSPIRVSQRQVLQLDENGERIARLFLPYRRYDLNDNDARYNQLPELFEVNGKLGWPISYHNQNDTTYYFVKEQADGALDSTAVELPGGRGTFLVWLNPDLSIVDVMNIPFTGALPYNSGIDIHSVSLFNPDTLMITGTIDGGTTTAMDPEGVASEVTYNQGQSFIAFYTVPDYLTSNHSPGKKPTPEFSLYPNPAQRQVTIRSAFSQGGQYRVTDITGRLITRGVLPAGDKLFRLNVVDYIPGMYVFTLWTEGATPQSQKFVVTK